MSSLFNSYLRRKSVRKCKNSFYDFVNYKVGDLIAHLERQFLPGMGWHNMDKWHVDHIIPVSSFDLTKPEEISRCWDLPNLRPLWREDNIKKGAKAVYLV